MKEQFPEEYIMLNILNPDNTERQTEVPIHNNLTNTTRSLNILHPDNIQLIERFKEIKTSDELKSLIYEVLIRFDTSPKNYTKEDYAVLIKLLYSALLYLYGQIEEFKPPIISVNEQQIDRTEENEFKLSIGTDDSDHLEVETSNGAVNIKTKVGEMETSSNKLATINDIRNYIENKLSWKIYG